MCGLNPQRIELLHIQRARGGPSLERPPESDTCGAAMFANQVILRASVTGMSRLHLTPNHARRGPSLERPPTYDMRDAFLHH